MPETNSYKFLTTVWMKVEAEAYHEYIY